MARGAAYFSISFRNNVCLGNVKFLAIIPVRLKPHSRDAPPQCSSRKSTGRRALLELNRVLNSNVYRKRDILTRKFEGSPSRQRSRMLIDFLVCVRREDCARPKTGCHEPRQLSGRFTAKPIYGSEYTFDRARNV